tara:strand:- start:26 stop:1066 length:1041 start_codon:yes stop_codon:yes gene_type:complete
MSGYLKQISSKPTAVSVYLVYVTMANAEWLSYPSLDTLVKATGKSRSAVSDARQFLLTEGFIIDTGERMSRCPVMRVETSVHNLLAYKLANQPLLFTDNTMSVTPEPPEVTPESTPEAPDDAPDAPGAMRPTDRAHDDTENDGYAPGGQDTCARFSPAMRPAGTALTEEQIRTEEEASGGAAAGQSAGLSNSVTEDMAATLAGWGIGEPKRGSIVLRCAANMIGMAPLNRAKAKLGDRSNKTGLLIIEINSQIDAEIANRSKAIQRRHADQAAEESRRRHNEQADEQQASARAFIDKLTAEQFTALRDEFVSANPRVPISLKRESTITACTLHAFERRRTETAVTA